MISSKLFTDRLLSSITKTDYNENNIAYFMNTTTNINNTTKLLLVVVVVSVSISTSSNSSSSMQLYFAN